MKRRSFGVLLTGMVVSAGVLMHSGLRQISSRFLCSFLSWNQTGTFLSERQKRIDAAERDLETIVQAELGHIRNRGKFATLNELVAGGDIGQEMLGRHGYVYSIRLEGTSIAASAHPLPGEELPALYNNFFGPALVPLLARLQENR